MRGRSANRYYDGITLAMLHKGAILADYCEVKKRSNRLAALITRANEITIKTAAGCDFKASLKGRCCKADTGIFAKRGALGICPRVRHSLHP